MIEPALFRTTTDVEIHALNRFQCADRILTTLKNVMHTGHAQRGVVAARALLPALAVTTGFAPTAVFARVLVAACGLAPFIDLFSGEQRALRDVDDGVDGAGVIHLVVRNRGSIGDAGSGMRK